MGKQFAGPDRACSITNNRGFEIKEREARWLLKNNSEAGALFNMARRRPAPIGPMSLQPDGHASTQAIQSPAVRPAGKAAAAAPKKRATAADALRAATARVIRRNSLRKQRQLQKADGSAG